MFLWLFFTLACSAIFLCMALFPQKWESLVSAENAFFVKKGWFSEGLAQKFMNIELSLGFQIAMAVLSIICFYNLVS